MKYKSNAHSKYLLCYHIIFVYKYKHKLFDNVEITNYIKYLSQEFCSRRHVEVKAMEVDRDHIHYFVSTKPNINISVFIMNLKSFITYHVWQQFDLSNFFWKRKTLFTGGYFIATIGSTSPEAVQQYIENQGRR